jgi:hypothetical protein
MSVPKEIAAKALFCSDRRCCVCRVRNKSLQIHHIDSDRQNHAFENLAVLCLDCHTETQKTGGFYRRLDAAQVRLYRDEWLQIVGREHMFNNDVPESGTPFGITFASRERVATLLLAARQYALLARHYHLIGDTLARDKFTEIALAEPDVPVQTEVALRLRQKRLNDVSQARLDAYLNGPHCESEIIELAQVYRELGRDVDALQTYCDSIMLSLRTGNLLFSAVLLKRLTEENFAATLLHEALRAAKRKNDVWAQVRCLRELDWEKELAQVLVANRTEVEQSANTLLRFELYKAVGDCERLNAAYVRLYQELADRELPPRSVRRSVTPAGCGVSGL